MAGIAENKLVMVIITILIPPVAVAIKDGLGLHFIINLVLTLLFYVPGLIHGLWRVLR